MRKVGGLAPLRGAPKGGLAPLGGKKKKKKKTGSKKKEKGRAEEESGDVVEEVVEEVIVDPVPALVISDSSEYDYQFSEDDSGNGKAGDVEDDGLVAAASPPAREEIGSDEVSGGGGGTSKTDVPARVSPPADTGGDDPENTSSHSNRSSRRPSPDNSPDRRRRTRPGKPKGGAGRNAKGSSQSTAMASDSDILPDSDGESAASLSRDVRSRLAQLTSPDCAAVSLADACLGDPGCVAVARALRNPQCAATSLDLRGNQIRAEGAVALGAALRRNRRLRTLSLEWNSLGLFPEGVRSLASIFALGGTGDGGHGCNVTSLDLRNNRLTAGAGTALAGALKTNRALVSLDLRWNSLGELGSKALAVAMEQNNTLTALHMSGNAASNATLRTIRGCCERNKGRSAKKHQKASSSSMSASAEGGFASSGPSLSSSFAMQDDDDAANTSNGPSSPSNRTPLDPESLEGATSIIQALEQALRLQRAEAKDVAERLEAETLSHTRTREALTTAQEEVKRHSEVMSKHAETLRLERERAGKERAKAAADSQSRLHRMSEIQTEADRERFDAEAKVRTLNEELADVREQLRQSQQSATDAKDRLASLQHELTSAAAREDTTRSEHQRALGGFLPRGFRLFYPRFLFSFFLFLYFSSLDSRTSPLTVIVPRRCLLNVRAFASTTRLPIPERKTTRTLSLPSVPRRIPPPLRTVLCGNQSQRRRALQAGRGPAQRARRAGHAAAGRGRGSQGQNTARRNGALRGARRHGGSSARRGELGAKKRARAARG